MNLIGEHIDYHGLPVLPIAIERCISLEFRPRADRTIRAVSPGFANREFKWTEHLEPSASGDWANYIKAAAQAVGDRWGVQCGIDAEVQSTLPAAAGLSSSSALLVAFTLALLRSNGIEATLDELMDVLPEAEYFVGTRGGGMDHAAVLASRAGHALLVKFRPFSATPIPIPREWAILVAHSLTTAEKSGAVRAEYNARRTAGTRAFEAIRNGADLDSLPIDQRDAYLHVTTEAARVEEAVAALRAADSERFGRALVESHASLRDQLRVSNAALDSLVKIAMEAGAIGARLTGAGFGGCAVVACRRSEREQIRRELIERFYSNHAEFDPDMHLIDAEPSNGALYAQAER